MRVKTSPDRVHGGVRVTRIPTSPITWDEATTTWDDTNYTWDFTSGFALKYKGKVRTRPELIKVKVI